MSTATNTSSATQFARHGKTMFWRFVWKEFRMIRSLWAAVAIMGLLVQCAELMLLPGSSERPMMLLYTALAAAVLYAAGAAATTFSVEHEEETFDLLARLPTTWWPPFAGKVVVTLVSALLLACLLSIPALMSRGPNFTGQDARNALSVMGFAILEAVTWGTLFSLLIKRPLLAAIVTLVVGAVMVNVLVTYSSTYAASALSADAYVHALPRRLAIVAAVFACSLYVASDWLTPSSGRRLAAHLGRNGRLMTWLASGRSRTREVKAVAQRAPRRRLLAHLLWQSWRESWKLLLAPLAVAFLLLAGITAATGLAQQFNEATSFVISSGFLFAPALYGAMAFYADQRRGNYRFLAEHAARPRYIWLARHIIWLGAFITFWFLPIGGFAAFVGIKMERGSWQMLEEYLEWRDHASAVSLVDDFALGSQIVLRIVSGASFGALVAYGIGQLFSMTIRSEILAAFLALLVTFIVAAWVWVVGLWQLSVLQFLFPLFAGLMLATWLRAPDWITGRNSWRGWWKPALAAIGPVLLVAGMLPSARLAQVRPIISHDSTYNAKQEGDRAFAERLAMFEAGNTTEAARTADMYTRAATMLTAGTSEDLFERWRKPEYLKTIPTGPPGSTEIDETKIPPDQLQAYRKAQRQQSNLVQESIAATINEAIEISKRPSCRFHFDANSLAPNPCNCIPPNSSRPQPCGLAYNKTYQNMKQLIGAVVGEPINQHEEPRHFLAALRMGQHLRSGQPSVIVIDQLRAEPYILAQIARWALESDRTKEELRDALDKLTAPLYSPESPADGLLADHVLIRAVIEGREMPCILSTTPIEPHTYLAYLANQLWWERERAGNALDRITRSNIAEVEGLTEKLNNMTPSAFGIGVERHWLRPENSGLPEPWQIMNSAAVTSYLVSLEYQARVPISELNRAYCENVTYRHATLLQIALALYRLDHKKYPTQLADLVPEYLEQLPLDPYARQPFQYNPSGLDLPLTYSGLGRAYQEVKPNTSLLWSVGLGNVRIREFNRTRSPEENVKPTPEGEEPTTSKPKPHYEFVNEDQTWWNNNTLAFALPK